jgi:hypothetical protein
MVWQFTTIGYIHWHAISIFINAACIDHPMLPVLLQAVLDRSPVAEM